LLFHTATVYDTAVYVSVSVLQYMFLFHTGTVYDTAVLTLFHSAASVCLRKGF
jgi:hypothetical protein